MVKRLLRYLFYDVYCPALLLVSADKLLSAMTRSKKLIIMYHGVRGGRQRINARHVTAADFERQLRYFTRYFSIVSLREICEMQTRGIVPSRRTIALTFDDGFLNNVTVALPLLRKYRAPATFFLCSAAVEDRSYVHPSDLLDLIRTNLGGQTIRIGEDTFIRNGHRLISTTTGVNVYKYVSSLPMDRWHAVMSRLKSESGLEKRTDGVDEELYALIDTASLTELANEDLADIGSHCHHHVDLTRLEGREIDGELESSKKILGVQSGRRIESVAFPYGDYNADVIGRARALGFKYLIAGGDVPEEFSGDVFPRVGVLDGGSFAWTILSIRRGFGRFGF